MSAASAGTLTVEIDPSPAYESILSLSVFSTAAEQETYEVGREWFDAIRTQTSPRLLADIDHLSGGSELVWAHVLSLVYEAPPPRDVPTFLAYLGTVEPLEVRLRLLGYYVRYFRRATPPEVMAAAAEGNTAAQQQMVETSYPSDAGWQAALRVLLPLDAESTKHRLLEVLRRWQDEVWSSREPDLLPILTRDADEKRSLLQRLPPEGVIEAALRGVEYVPEPGIRRVLLVPSYVIRPQIHSFEHHEVKIFAYPVADESVSADPDRPAPHLVRLLKALSDERRLCILKRLTTGSYTLQEMSTHFEVGNTTMLHHLVILRSAGLVRLKGGTSKRYVLTPHAVSDLSRLLERYLNDRSA